MITNNDEKKRLVSNIFSLGVLQAANYIMPLLTMPYLTRVLGPEYFGLLAFISAVITFFATITEYGFNLSATRQVSIHRENKDKVNEIFSSVMIVKNGLMLVSFLTMSLLVFSFERFGQHWEAYFLTFGLIIGQVLSPVWLFHGMERMKFVTYVNIITKAFSTFCIFIFLEKKDDYLLVPFLVSMGYILGGILSLYLVKKEFNVCFAWQNVDTLKFQLAEGWHVFFSSVAISFYNVSATFILGMFANNITVGYFSAAEKIVQSVKGIYRPVEQAIYPLIGKKINENKKEGLMFIRKLTLLVGAGMLTVSIILFLMSEAIVGILFGSQYIESNILLKGMAFLPFIFAMNNMHGIQTMLNLGYNQPYSRIVGSAAILGIGLNLLLVPVYEDVGTVVVLWIIEVFLMAVMYFYLKKRS